MALVILHTQTENALTPLHYEAFCAHCHKSLGRFDGNEVAHPGGKRLHFRPPARVCWGYPKHWLQNHFGDGQRDVGCGRLADASLWLWRVVRYRKEGNMTRVVHLSREACPL